jgi:hypothetical protein
MVSGGRLAPSRWLAAFTLAIPGVYLALLIPFAHHVGTADYDQFRVFHELQYWNANLFGLAKQWSPLMCAGLSIAGEPQVPFASLTMLWTYWLGPSLGILVGVGCYLTIGAIGAYLYSGLWYSPRRVRLLAAALFIGNGFFICRLAHGHLDFIPFLALPLALWTLHRTSDPADVLLTGPRRILAVLLLGALFAMVVDGAPVAIIHWAFWVGLYAACLSWTRRSAFAVLVFVSACGLASLLDAGYLWPMLEAQSDFPRRTADTFTGPWSLPWFMLIPMRGKLLPANGTGIELSVCIGPFLAYLIWRYRRIVVEKVPREVVLPTLIVSLVSIWLGMGSLHAAHVPVWLSPFDWLRPLPGFRSMNVTGRFWGFLALPLSLLAARSLWHYVQLEPRPKYRNWVLLGALVTQLVFQGQSLLSAWWQSPPYSDPPLQGLFTGAPREIETVVNPSTPFKPRHQGEFISPVRGVTNCYDMDDFTRAPVRPGRNLIRELRVDGSDRSSGTQLQVGFVTWNRIRIATPAPADAPSMIRAGSRLQITLNQAYHSGWSSQDCVLTRADQGNLVASCPANIVGTTAAELVFFDPVSDLGMRVSVRTAFALLWVALALGMMSLIPSRRPVVSTAPATAQHAGQ